MKTRNKTTMVLVVVALMMVLVVGAAMASAVTNPPDHTFGTAPGNSEDIQDGLIKVGNAGSECAQLGTELGAEFTYAYKFNEAGITDIVELEGAPNGTETAEFFDVNGNLAHSNMVTISNSDGAYFDWSSSPNGIGAVMVKSSTGYNVWHYDPQSKNDSHLNGWVNDQGTTQDVSHVTFCWNLDETVRGEWCSPGYWRQEHHLDSWEATGYQTTDSFEVELGYSVELSKKGERAGATTDPTLLQVLESPQYYGGDAFNAVGDMLSDAHPDVNFGGQRVEDSCPLN